MKKIIVLSLLCILVLININVASASLSYWSEGINTNDKVYVKIPELEANETIHLILSKESGYNPDGITTFPELFENFTSSTLNSSLWIASDGYTIADGVLYPDSSDYVRSVNTYNMNEYIMCARVKQASVPQYNIIAGIASGTSIGTGTIYEAIFRTYNYQMSLGNIHEGTGSAGYTIPNIADNTEYYNFELYRQGSTNYISATDSNGATGAVSSSTYSTTQASNYLFIRSQGAINYLDHIYLRKYVDTEPTVIVTDEGDYYTIDITENSGNNLTEYQIYFYATDISLLSATESLLIYEDVSPSINVSLISPANDSYITNTEFSFNILGLGDFYSYLYIDDIIAWNGSVSEGQNNIDISTNLSQGLHTWYINSSSSYYGNLSYNISESWSFIYDTINPIVASTYINPDYENIANGTIVQTNIEWSDVNLKNASFYVDYGSGYSLEDSITFSSTEEWFNASIDTTGHTGETISWYQIAYDEAGNSYTYSDSFAVILNALNIYVYDESTGVSILPEQVKIYNSNISYFATIYESTNVSSLSYSSVDSSKYIVSVSKGGYYARNSIVDVDITTLSELNMYLIDENQTVIYDQFELIDYTREYDYDDVIIRLDKPLESGTDIVFESYLDFAGTSATYLIATDQYILYVILPDRTINYGWLTPDADGVVTITLNSVEMEDIYNEWLEYTFDNTDSEITLSYESQYDVNESSFIVYYADNMTELYSATSETNTGTFDYSISTDATLYISFNVVAENGQEFSNYWVIAGTASEKDVFPDSYPQWLKNTVVTALAILCILAFSSYRVEVGLFLGVGIVGVAYLWEEYEINNYTGYTISLMVFITILEFVIQQKKEARR